MICRSNIIPLRAPSGFLLLLLLWSERVPALSSPGVYTGTYVGTSLRWEVGGGRWVSADTLLKKKIIKIKIKTSLPAPHIRDGTPYFFFLLLVLPVSACV